MGAESPANEKGAVTKAPPIIFGGTRTIIRAGASLCIENSILPGDMIKWEPQRRPRRDRFPRCRSPPLHTHLFLIAFLLIRTAVYTRHGCFRREGMPRRLNRTSEVKEARNRRKQRVASGTQGAPDALGVGVAAHASFRPAPGHKIHYTTNRRLHEGHVASGA